MGIPNRCEYNISFKHKSGVRNLITDVPGVKVGNETLIGRDINTGVTAILPHDGDLFHDKVMAACYVLNGFGKSVGLTQIDELGFIETPIIFTNTFSVGTALNALTQFMLVCNKDIGVSTGAVNCIITECNDGKRSDIRSVNISEDNVIRAIMYAKEAFDEGNVGAGTGMSFRGIKGGIGSASRVIEIDDFQYTIGSIVMSNIGELGISADGRETGFGRQDSSLENEKEESSIVTVIATDIPLSERQLKKICKTTAVSLSSYGLVMGSSGGDIAIAFSTANHVPQYSKNKILNFRMFYDKEMDTIFEATVEAVEEAVLSSLIHTKSINDAKENSAKNVAPEGK